MKRVIVIGCPGSGKSTFSKALHKITKIPLYHLDMIYWNRDQTTVPKAVFLDRLSKILQKEEWIIDGNYGSTMEQRIQVCDTVFFLDYPTALCLKGIEERRGTKRSDLPWVEQEFDEDFLAVIKNYPSQSRPKVMELLERYSQKEIVIFSSRRQAEDYLKKLQ